MVTYPQRSELTRNMKGVRTMLAHKVRKTNTDILGMVAEVKLEYDGWTAYAAKWDNDTISCQITLDRCGHTVYSGLVDGNTLVGTLLGTVYAVGLVWEHIPGMEEVEIDRTRRFW